jgi:mannose-6-phosphate isomerase
MADLYPFLLVPEFKERVWGTRDLRPFYTQVVSHEPIGEAWLTGDDCKVANGPLQGQTLGELCARFGPTLIGAAAPCLDRFPLLIKFLFPREKLSVQVHPDDEMAKRIGQPCGKTECWYVARAVAGAQVGLGVKTGTTRESFKEAIENKNAEHLLNWIDVKTGELVYVDAGTVHAIGPNAIYIETQQNSDTTYRLYDYGRARELHIEQGLEAMKETTHAGKAKPQSIDGHDLLVASPCFIVERFAATEPMTITADPGASSAQVLVAADGCGVIESEGSQPVTFNKGEAVVIPASIAQFQLRPQWSVEYLRMRLPAEKLSHPVTTMPSNGVATS